MAYIRGIFDTADRAVGHRIVYLFLVSLSMNFGAFVACLVFAGLLIVCQDAQSAFQLFFIIAAAYVLLPMGARFHLYR